MPHFHFSYVLSCAFFVVAFPTPKKTMFFPMLAFRPARRFLPFILCCVLSSARPQGNAACTGTTSKKIQLNQVNMKLSYTKDQMFQATKMKNIEGVKTS